MSNKTGTMTDRLMQGVQKGKQGILLALCIAVCCLVGGAVAVNARPSIDESEVGIASPQVQDGPAGEATTVATPLDAPGSCLPRFARPELLAEVPNKAVPEGLAAVDLNQDGLVDLFTVFAGWSAGDEPIEPAVLLNDGSGGLQDVTASVFVGSPPRIEQPRIFVAEFNGDGRPDLFVAEGGYDDWPYPGGQSALILSAPGDKLVDATDSLPDETGFTHWAAAADIDGDSDVDLFLCNISQDPPQLWLNNGSGGFTRGQEERLPQAQRDLDQNVYTASLFADVDGDGAPDLILGTCGAKCGKGDVSVVLLNDGQGWFSLLPGALPQPSWHAADHVLDIQAADLNGDHHLDLLMIPTVPDADLGGHIQILIGNGDGTFRDETGTRLPQGDSDLKPFTTVRTIDLDYDGDLDLVTGVQMWNNHTVPFYINDGLGYFTPWQRPLAPTPYDFGDVDGDGRRDLLFVLEGWSGVPDYYFAMRGLPCPAAFLPLVVKAGEPSEPVVEGIVELYPYYAVMEGLGWAPGETLSVDVRTPGGALKDTTFGTADSQGELTARFHNLFGSTFGPREGDRITLIPEDGAPVTFPVKLPQAAADPKANTIVGVAEPGSRVEAAVLSTSSGTSARMETQAAYDGSFSFDFSPLLDWAGSDRLEVGHWVTDYAGIFIAEDSPEMELVGSAHINLDAPYHSLDPAFAAGDSDFHVVNQLFAGLTRQDEETGEIFPDLASSWEIAPDGKSITFRVPISDISWSNGDPFSGEDVCYGLQRAQLHSPYSYILDAIGVVDYDNLSDRKVRIDLDKPMAGVVPAIVAMPPFRPVPHHLVDAHGDDWADADTIVSSGPFRVVAEGPGLLELERNPHYHDVESVTISEVGVYAIEDAIEATQRYASGDLDVTMTYDFDMVNGDPTLSEEVHRWTYPCTSFVGFTTNKPPLDNVLVRKALIAATDRDEAMAEGYGAAAALTFAPPGVFGAVPPGSGIGIEYDPTQAQNWLDQSGVATPFTITLAHSTGARNAAIAQRVAGDWETNLGINVVIESREWEDYEEWIGPETPVEAMPHAWLLTSCGAYYDQHNWAYDSFHSQAGRNWIRWSNAEFDDVTDQAAASADLAQREVWYQRAEEILNEEQAGILSLFWAGNSQLSKPYLERTFSRNMGEQIRNWYFR